MQTLVIVLNKVEYMKTVLKILKDSGIRGATIIDGLGSNAKSNRQLTTTSFLASLVESLEQTGEVKKIIFSVVEKESQIEKATKLIDETVNQDDEKTSGAFMFTIPVGYTRGGEIEKHINRREKRLKEEG
jgi:PII-like signaling protein